MSRQVNIIRGVVLLASVLTAARVSASLFEPVGDAQLVCEATDIVRGQVTAVESAWDANHRAIWTTATVQVDEVLRGSLSPGTGVQVKEVGGTAEGYTIVAESFPTFRQGEEAVLLLRPWEDGSGALRVWGYGRGMFRVDRGPGGVPTARRFDLADSGQATMHVDRIPPAVVLDTLSQQLRGLAKRCEAAGAAP
jgi:hypothetical protein